MLKPGKYNKNPITEAVIEIRAILADDFGVSRLEDFGRRVPSYSKKRAIRRAVGSFHFSEAPSSSISDEVIGWRFDDPEANRVVLVRKEGFAFSLLPPYEAWQPFRDEARRLWDVYVEITQPQKITRFSVRTINRIDIPKPVGDLKDWFRTTPEVSSDLPQSMSGFFMRVELPIPAIDARAAINQTIVEAAVPETIAILLDIDLLTSTVPDEPQEIWNAFDRLRDWKDHTFEACITDKTRELFEPCH